MIELNITHKLETLQYQIPNSWQDITVEKFSKLFSNVFNEDITEIEKLVTNISILTDIPEDTLYKLSKENFKLISSYFNFLDTPILDDFSETISLGDEIYYLKSDFKSMNFGEITSLEIILNKNNGNIMSCMPELLTVLLRKKDGDELEEYSTTFKSRIDKFKDIKITDVYSIFTFFLDSKKQ